MTPTALSLLSAINVARIQRRVTCVVRRSKVSNGLTTALRKHNLIYGAARRTAWQSTVFLRYFRGKSVLTSLRAVSVPSRRVRVSARQAVSLVRYHPALVFLFSTSFGVVGTSGQTMLTAKLDSTGGELLAVAW